MKSYSYILIVLLIKFVIVIFLLILLCIVGLSSPLPSQSSLPVNRRLTGSSLAVGLSWRPYFLIPTWLISQAYSNAVSLRRRTGRKRRRGRRPCCT